MSGWGTWPDEESGDVHIVPCDRDYNVVGGHTQSMTCFCKPVRNEDEPRQVVHFDPERGGFNA
jgi:hypothetical protein